jgi:iron complex outermembrane receptor protein
LKHTLKPVAAALLLLATSIPAFADDNGESIIVTATRLPEKATDEAVDLTVITRTDIERSAATTPQQLLAGITGVAVRNLDSSNNGSVDLRGFGVGGTSNTLILIDGLPLNDNDLSAPLLSSLSLDRIERIEIVRGSSLAWGGGSTGGVINIITRQGHDGDVGVALGSHGMRQVVGGAGFGDVFTLRLDGQDGRDDGYRQNDALRTHSGEVQAGWHGQDIHLAIDVARDQQWQGFPGPRAVVPGLSDEFSTNPDGTDTPLDHGETDETRYALRGDGKLADAHWAIDATRRDKNTASFFGDYGFGAYNDQRTSRDERVSPRVSLPIVGAALTVGLDWRKTSATDINTYGGGGSDLHAQAGWLDFGMPLGASTRITLGARTEHVKQDANALGGPAMNVLNTNLHAWELGLRQALATDVSMYLHAGQSYRLPNADELANNSALLPQTAHDMEVGFDAKVLDGHARLALFRINLENEIAFQRYVQGYGNNINLSPTRHQGAEASWNSQAGAFDYGVNLTWLDATFLQGNYGGYDLSGKRIPLVAQIQGNLQAGWAWNQADRLDLQWHASGRSRMDNDAVNEGAWLAGWSTLDIKLTHSQGPWRLTLAGRNLVNQRYATYGIVSADTSNPITPVSAASSYNLYPEDGRTWQATASYRF